MDNAQIDSEYDKYNTPQFNYVPFGFGVFDTTDEEKLTEKIYYYEDNKYARSYIAKKLNISINYVDGVLKRRRSYGSTA